MKTSIDMDERKPDRTKRRLRLPSFSTIMFSIVFSLQIALIIVALALAIILFGGEWVNHKRLEKEAAQRGEKAPPGRDLTPMFPPVVQ